MLAGHTVVFLERPRAVAELSARGLKLHFSASQTISLMPTTSHMAFASSLSEALSHGPFDAALLAIKSYDTAGALQEMQPHAGLLPPILCLQNGVDNEAAIAAALGPDHVIAGTVTTSVGRGEPGEIVLERLRGVGVAGGHRLSETLLAALNGARLNARHYAHAAGMKWSKMLTNVLANASSAILNMSPAEIFGHNGLFRMEMSMLREALTVMRALQLRVVDLPGTPVRALAWAARLPSALAQPMMARAVAGGRGAKMPSFHIDLHSGRKKSEVGFLNGAVVRAGERAGVATPINRFLTQTLLALTRGELALDTFARNPERFLSAVPGQTGGMQ